MKLQKLLKGFKLGNSQVVGNMRVVPILTDTEFTRVGSVDDIYLDRDVHYGTLRMATESKDVTIIPQGMMYIVSEAAQDRTIPSAHIIKGKSAKEVNANCLQPSQGGYMSQQEKKREWGILPSGLRESALSHAKESNYSALWGDMEKFMNLSGIHGRELVKFFQEFRSELDSFVAQYEPVEKQVGAFFIINDTIVGIELTPNYLIWKQMWKPLIRDCYGSESVVFVKKGYSSVYFRPTLDPSNVNTIDDLENAVKSVYENEKGFVSQVIESAVDQSVSEEEEEVVGDFALSTIETDDMVGQVVRHGPERTVYLSMVLKNAQKASSRKRKFDSRWNTDSPYRNDSEFEI